MRKKVYGSYQKASCPFCGGTATTKNQIGISVCKNHVNTEGMDIKCTCGSWLDIKEGKYGTFFLCDNCGPVSMSKAMEIKSMTGEKEVEVKYPEKVEVKTDKKKSYKTEKKEKNNEIFISTNDIEYFS